MESHKIQLKVTGSQEFTIRQSAAGSIAKGKLSTANRLKTRNTVGGAGL